MPIEDALNYDGRFSAAYEEALRQVIAMDVMPDIRRVNQAVLRLKQWNRLPEQRGNAEDIGPAINSIYGAKDVGYVLDEITKGVEYLNEVARYLRDYLERN